MRAPVAAKIISLISPVCTFGRKYPQSTLAEQPQPEPPAWVSCSSSSNIIAPQSLCCAEISRPSFSRSSYKSLLPTIPKSPVTIASKSSGFFRYRSDILLWYSPPQEPLPLPYCLRPSRRGQRYCLLKPPLYKVHFPPWKV